MKSREIRAMDNPALNEKIVELKKELIKMNAQVAIGSAIKNSAQVGEIKKTIAKIYTIQKEKQIASGSNIKNKGKNAE